jgi:CRISPR-associated endonuclease Csn1
MDIVRMRDGSWKGFAANIFEVNRKGWRPVWEREKLGGLLVMRLHKGDMVEVDEPDGRRAIKRVVRLEPSAGRIRLVEHFEGGDLEKRHVSENDAFRWDLASISRLRDRRAIKLRIVV